MKILPDIQKDSALAKPEVETVVNQKMEFTLLGTYQLSKGFTLFGYNPATDEIMPIEIKQGEFIQCELTTEGWIWFDPENMQTTIDSLLYYFEALNIKKARNRVEKMKAGKLNDICNLKKPGNGTIDIFKPL